MAKRTVQRLLALALAGSMSLSVLATAAMAVDYDIAGGTVNVTDDGSGVQSWQGDGEKSSDTTINITNKENITTDKQVVNVGEGVGSDVTINIDGVNADVTDTSAVEANGGTVNITDSSLSGGTEDEAAVVVGGDANVNISGETEIIGSGTGLEVNGGSVTVKDGADVTIVGNDTTVTGGENDVSGTGVEVTGGTVTVEEGAEVEITGSDVTVKGTGEEITISGDSVGMEVTGGTVNVEGSVDSLGQYVTVPSGNKSDFTVDVSGSAGISVSGGSLNVAKGGEVAAVDHNDIKNQSSSKPVYTFVENSSGKYILYNGEYKQYNSIVYTTYNGVKNVRCFKILVKGGNPAVWDYVPVEGTTRYIQKTNYVKPTMTVDGAGTGLDLSGSAQVKAEGSLLASGSETGLAMADSVKVTVGPDGRLIASYVSKNGGTIDNEGLVFVQEAAEGLREAINNSGTGLRFVSYEYKDLTVDGDENCRRTLHLYWEAGKNESAQELVVPLKEMVMDAWNALYCAQNKQFAGTAALPGYHINFDIQITNKSGYTYSYKADSLVVGVGAEAMDPNNPDLRFRNARVANAAVQALYGKTASGKVTVDELLAVEKTLRETGYKGQTFDSLEAFYLYYIEEQTGKKYDSLVDVPYEDYKYTLNYDAISTANSTLYVTDEEYEELLQLVEKEYGQREYELYDTGRRMMGYKVIQIKETGNSDAMLVYRYKYCLAYGFGESVDADTANLKEPPYSTYLDNPLDYLDKAVWQKANDYFAGQIGKDGLTTGQSATSMIYLLLDGMLTNNKLENSAFSLENYIVLKRVDPPTPTTPPEEPGEPGGPYVPDNRLRGGYGSFALADNFVNEITIEDEDVPLADVPKTGDVSMLWLVLSGLCAAVILLGMKRRRTTQA